MKMAFSRPNVIFFYDCPLFAFLTTPGPGFARGS